MEKVGSFFKSSRFYAVIGSFLAFLMVFLLLPEPLFAIDLSSPSSALSVPAWISGDEPSEPSLPPDPQITAQEVSPDNDSSITSSSGKITVSFPKGAVNKVTNIEIAEYYPESSTGMRMINQFELNASLAESGESVTKFNVDLPITITHTKEELEGIDTDTLRLYYLDEKSLEWVPLDDCKFDSKTLTLTAYTNHFTNYGEQATPEIVGPGKVMAAQVSLYSGAATFNYPLELPSGPGGFKPSIDLNYNSGSVDGMKNKQSVGSWVGTGWEMKLGSISYDSTSKTYTLDFSGGSYELVTADDVTYHTRPEAYYRVTRSGNTWEILGTDGSYYRFGGTADSQQYMYKDSVQEYYRWDMTLIRDTSDNEASISYVQEIRGTGTSAWVRSAYPEYMTYGEVEIHFISSWDEDDATDGHLRADNPKTYNLNKAPKVMENRKLDAVEIKVSDTLIRKYVFNYTTTARVYSSDYSGIYYAGKHTLNSITQIGADGTSSQPAMSFTYENKSVYRRSYDTGYTGNPGNPASLSWPFLTVVNSGYGGSISFTYTQIPGTNVYGLWTRQVVTTKTINSGIGSNETYYYTYTGYPQYYERGWDQEFRGFSEVRETYTDGNYIQHYFYTTGLLNNKDAEKLTGKEYKTQYYNSSNTLLKEELYDWDWTITSQTNAGTYESQWQCRNNTTDIAILPDEYIYVLTDGGLLGDDDIYRYDIDGTHSTGITLTDEPASGICVSSDDYLYASIRRNLYYSNNVFKYDLDLNRKSGFSHTDTSIGVAVSPDNYVYVITSYFSYPYMRYPVRKFDSTGTAITDWDCVDGAAAISVGPDNYVYVATYNLITGNYLVKKYDPNGNLVTSWSCGTVPKSIFVSKDNYVHVVTNSASNNIQVYTSTGTLVTSWTCANAKSIVTSNDDHVYISTLSSGTSYINIYDGMHINWAVQLKQKDVNVGAKTLRTRYLYDSYGNLVTQYNDGDTSTNTDDSTVWRTFYPNTTANILDKVARERTYATIMTSDSGGANLKQESLYYYDGNNTSLTTPPTEGKVTRVEQKKDSSNSVSSYYTYDDYGNVLTSQDNNGNVTSWTYETTYHLYPLTKTYPITGMSESYTFDPGTDNMLSKTDINGQTTYYEYDTFKRQIKTIKPGDTSQSPSIEYQYNNWGTINQQNLKTIVKISDTESTWQSQYFDGLGRVVQIQTQGETGRVIISSTTVYSTRGLTDKEYVSQDLDSASVSGYNAPEAAWKYTAYTYDCLGRVLVQTNADGTTVSHDYSNAWEEIVTNERSVATNYFYDAFNQLVKVQENIAGYNFVSVMGNQVLADGEVSNPQGIVVDSGDSYIYVVDAGNSRIQKFSTSGKYNAKWGSAGTGNGQFSNPGGIAIYSSYVYVADSGNNRIQKFNTSGSYSTKWGSAGTGDGQFNNPWGVAASSSYVYVADSGNNRIQRFNTTGTFGLKWGTTGTGDGEFNNPTGIALDSSGNVYVVDSGNNRIQKFDASGTYITQWGTSGSGNGEFDNPIGISVDSNGNVYVMDTGNSRVQKFDSSGTYIAQWGTNGSSDGQFSGAVGITASANNNYVADTGNSRIQKFNATGTFTIKWGYAGYGNGNFENPTGLVIVPSTSNMYVSDSGNNRIQYFNSSGTYVGTFGSYGTADGQFNNPAGMLFTVNVIFVVDSGNNRVQKFNTSGYFNSKWGTYGTGNGQFDNPQGIAKDSSGNIYVVDSGNNRVQKFNTSGTYSAQWGSYGTGQGQFDHPTGIAIINNEIYVTDSGNNRVQKFNTSGTFIAEWGMSGAGVGEFDNPTGIAADSSGNIYVVDNGNNRVQKFTSGGAYLNTWGYTGSGNGQFDSPNGIMIDSSGNIFVADSGNDRIQKFVAGDVVTNTNYTYDVLGNLVQVVDNNSNTTSITYDWLSRKTAMSDPDMGNWSYGYDANGNLTSQTDAKAQTITFVYDALNRLTNKNYQAGSNMTDVVYSYDSTSGGNYGVGKRTGMTDAAGTMSYIYDARGRVIQETRTINSIDYITSYTYDGLDRIVTATLPTAEVVTNSYNGRGLAYALSGTDAGDLVTSTLYNQLGQLTEINLGNTLKTTFGYYGLGGTYDTTGGYYGKLWEITTLPQAGGVAIQDVKYTWDATGNLLKRINCAVAETEYFIYDSIDRLVITAGAYEQVYTYDTIGNITAMNGTSYTYSTKPHAVTAVGAASYIYDGNGNMTNRNGQTITWDVENRPVAIDTETYVYDGDGNRISKTAGGETTLYINKYYETNVTTTEETTSYYLGDRLIATKVDDTLSYIHQDSLGSSSVMSDANGQSLSSITYYPFGGTRTGSVSTDKKFTGQRQEGTGLYYYNARYYDPEIGRFISADTVVQATPQTGDELVDALTVAISYSEAKTLSGQDNNTRYINSQDLNRYSYVLNNPLKYTDPTGNFGTVVAMFVIGFLTSVVVICFMNYFNNVAPTDEAMLQMLYDSFINACIAAVTTLLAPALGALGAGLAAAVIGDFINSIITGQEYTIEEILEDLIAAGFSAKIGKAIAEQLKDLGILHDFFEDDLFNDIIGDTFGGAFGVLVGE